MPIKYAKNNNGKDIIRGFYQEEDSFPVVQLTRNQAKWIIENINTITQFAKEEPPKNNQKLENYARHTQTNM